MHIQRAQPVAEQVLTLIRQRIQDKVYDVDQRLPSESDLAVELGVSRATIRSALSTLAAEKLIVRRQGDGTYINQRFVETTTHFGAISEFTRMIQSSGMESSIIALDIHHRPGLPQETSALNIAAESPVLVLERLFLASGQPAIYSIDTIPESLICSDLELNDIEEPLPDFFKHFCCQEFTYGISELCAADGNGKVATYLQLPQGTPIVSMHEIFYSNQDEPLVYALNYFNHKVFQLKVARSFE